MNIVNKNETNKKLIDSAVENSYVTNEINQINEKNILSYLKEELETILSFNDNIEMKKNRLNKFKVHSSVLEDYDQKIIGYGRDKELLAGIRHVSGNPEQPFVFVWPGFVLKSNDDIEKMKKEILPYFKKFKPKYINLWLSKNSELYSEIRKKHNPVQRLYVGNIKEIKDKENSGIITNGVIEKIKDEKYYDWYKDEYKRFHQKNPLLKDWVEVNSFELMEESRNDGLLYYYNIDKKRIGLIAGEKRRIFDKDAVYIDEILISESERGKKYATALMMKFINQLQIRNEFIWSHIDYRNIASIKTALNIGQKVISEEFLIQI